MKNLGLDKTGFSWYTQDMKIYTVIYKDGPEGSNYSMTTSYIEALDKKIKLEDEGYLADIISSYGKAK